MQEGSEVFQEYADLFERVKVAPEIEREQIIDTLYQKAKQTEAADDWNHLALIMQSAGRLEGAITILEQLVRAYPSNDVYRLNLATTFSQASQFELCRYHLRFLAEHSSNEEMRKLAKEQVAGLEGFLGQTEQDKRYRQLQLESLRECINASQAGEDDYIYLARALLHMADYDPNISLLEEAIAVLKEGQKRFPDSVDILEYLVLCYLRHDPEKRLEETLKQLEKVDPGSSALQVFSETTDEEGKEFLQNRHKLAEDLFARVQGNDPEVKQAALRDLGKMVASSPSNFEYRIMYAFALGTVGQCQEALQQATLAARGAGKSHREHFNLGQIFWICGDPEKGKYHLNLALAYASNDQEQQDVEEVVAYLRGGS